MKFTQLISIIAIVLLTPGCGAKVSVDPVKVSGNVTVTVTIDPTNLETFYKAYCNSKGGSQSQIDQCVADSLALFWQAVNSNNPYPVPSPSSTP